MQKIFIDSEKIKRDTFNKLDQFNYDYDYGKLSPRYNFINFDNITPSINDNAIEETIKKSKIKNEYRKKLDKRLDVINGKINDYSNHSYVEITNFLSTTLKSKPNETFQENREDYFDYSILKESQNEFNEGKYPSENNNDFINFCTNNTNKINNKNILANKIKNNNKVSSKNNNKNNNLCDSNNVINEKSIQNENSIIESNSNRATSKILEHCMKSINEIKRCQSERFPTRVQIVCKRDDADLINKKEKKNIYLENQMNILEKKLFNMEKQKDFLQNLIFKNKDIKKYMNDILMVEYFTKIAENWKEITNELIDDLIMDEIFEIGQIKKKEKKNDKNNISKLNGISTINNKELNKFEIEEFELFKNNLNSIKTIIKSVKETERNLCRKYKVKTNKKLY